MMSFSLSGGVEVVGFISPTDPLDTYPVIDPLYGIDGLRNVNTLTDLNNIPDLRRRAGMLVGVNNGSQFYKLNASPWNGTITDWALVNLGGADTYVTGTTFNLNQAILTRNDGFDVLKLSGGSNVTLSNPSTNQIKIDVSIPPDTNTFVTGFTYDNSNNLTINRNDGVDFSVNIDTMSGLTINGDLLVTGTTNISGLTVNGPLSACTGIYTSNIYGCSPITIHDHLLPVTDGDLDLGSPIRRFRDVNTISGTSTVWTSTNRVTTPEVDLGLDSLNNNRIITADNSIIQNDTLNGGGY